MRTNHPIAIKLINYIPLVMLSTWLNFGGIMSETFFNKFQIHFSPVEHSVCHMLGNVGPFDVKLKGNESGCFTDWGIFDLDLWPWIFKDKLYNGNGRLDCHGIKGTGVDRMPWCETLRKWINWMLCWLGYIWPWPLTWIFMVKLHLGNGRPDYNTHCVTSRQRILVGTGLT